MHLQKQVHYVDKNTPNNFCRLFLSQVPKAAANKTTSTGVRFSPGTPPMVPRMPEIDLSKATVT